MREFQLRKLRELENQLGFWNRRRPKWRIIGILKGKRNGRSQGGEANKTEKEGTEQTRQKLVEMDPTERKT